MHVKNGDLLQLENAVGSGCLLNLIRVGIHQSLESPVDNPIKSFEAIEWKHCSKVVVLKVVGLPGVSGALDLKELKLLRSLELHDVVGLDILEGLKGLKNLAYFKWRCYKYKAFNLDEEDRDCHTFVDQFPASLKVLRIKGGVLLGREVLAQCTNLCTLVLHGICVDNLDLSHCSSLESVKLKKVQKLKILLGLIARWASKLQSLKVWQCEDLVYILGLGRLIGLEQLLLEHCSNIELPDLQNLTKLQVLRLMGQREVESKVPSLGIAPHHQLQWKPMEVPTLNGFEWLQVLDLSWNSLSSLEGLGDLPALRCLDLSHCRIQSQLPDMSEYKSLEELKLVSSEIELHEEDIDMLASLPLLQPVPVGGSCVDIPRCRLDLVRKKVLNYRSRFGCGAPDSWLDWKKHGWIESSPLVPPIMIQKQTDLSTERSVLQSLRDVHPLEFQNFSNLQVLYLSRCKLPQSLPSSFCMLTELEVLALRETTLEALPNDFGKLCSLKEVDFGGCKRLKYLGESFCALSKLEVLTLRETPLQKLPNDFGKLCSLKEVDFGGCKWLHYLEESFCALSKLEVLTLRETPLQWLPDDFGQLCSLKKVDFGGCKWLNHLEESFCGLSKLEVLTLRETPLQWLPDDFGQLCSLKKVDFGGCKWLNHLEESFCGLSKLEVLTLRETPSQSCEMTLANYVA